MARKKKGIKKSDLIKKLAVWAYARLLFVGKRNEGVYPEVWVFEDLQEDEKEIYLTIARQYLENRSAKNWPDVIIEALGG